MIRDIFEQDLALWLPDQIEDDPLFISRKYAIGSQAISDFLDLKISPRELLEVLDDCDIDIDNYLDDVSYNINH